MNWSRKNPRFFMLLCLFGGAVLLMYMAVAPRTVQKSKLVSNIKYIPHNAVNSAKKLFTLSPIQFINRIPDTKPRKPKPPKNSNDCYNVTANSGIYEKFDCNKTVAQTKDIIAIGCAVTTHDMKISEFDSLGQTLTFLRTLLPSVCRSISRNFRYKFYIAYDQYDSLFSREDGLKKFNESYNEIKAKLCPTWADLHMKFVQCSHTGQPAWAQNDAMMDAYLENATYYFRVNDDTNLKSEGWTEKYIKTLESYDPPNVGVVGPAHVGGNEMILTHDFVHRTHIDIFGFYYPRVFQNWWADNWMTLVYQPNRMTKLDDIEVVHTWERGTRYNHSEIKSMDIVYNRAEEDRKTLKRYIEYIRSKKLLPDPKKVISMSLYNSDIKYTYGAIRNAVLQPLVFPGWTLRIYLERPGSDGYTRYPDVPTEIILKLKDFGVQLYYVDWNEIQVPPMMWRFLVADDETVDWFIVRDSDSRLIDRDAKLVNKWMEDGAPLYCVRDHPSHVSDPLFGGLWGGRPKELRMLTKAPMTLLMKGAREDYGQDIYILSYILWPRVRDFAFCFDSISCHRYVNSHGVNQTREGSEHVGQVFSAFSEPRAIDIDILQHTNPADFCFDKPKEEMPKHSRDDDDQATFEDIEDLVVSPFKFKNLLIWTINYDVKAVMDITHVLQTMGARFLDFNFDDNCASFNNCATAITAVGSKEKFFEGGEEFADVFSKHLKVRPDFKNITHFLCVYPISLCELYMEFTKPPYNKSVIMVAKDRYEWGREDEVRWRQLNRNILRLSWDPRNLVAANNHYDLEYMRNFLGSGIPLNYIPSYCGYVKATYKPKRDGYLVMPVAASPEFEKWFVTKMNETMVKNRIRVHFHLSTELYGKNATFEDIASHTGIIHIPEQVSMTTVCEYYQMSIPVFIPSLGLMVEWHRQWGLLKDRTLNSLRNSTKSVIEGISKTADPNDDTDEKAIKYWLRFADIYQWPYLQPYDSIEHLIYLLTNIKINLTSKRMTVFNKKLQRQVTEKWVKLLEQISRI